MNKTLTIQEMAIAVATQSHNPAVLTSDFLKYSGIIPTEWELAQRPIQTAAAAQITFRNGVNIVAQTNRIIFAEAMSTKAIEDITIAAIARRYIHTLPQVNYRAVGINFVGYVSCDETSQTAHDYIFATLFTTGAWQEFGETPVQATVQLGYTFGQAQLSLTISPAKLRLPEQTETSAVLFSANFNHAVPEDNKDARLDALMQAIDQWQADLTLYHELINTRFLLADGESQPLKRSPLDHYARTEHFDSQEPLAAFS